MMNVRTMVYLGLAMLTALLMGAVFLSAQAQDEIGDAAPIGVLVQTVSLSKSTQISTSYAGIISARRTSALGFERGGLVVDVRADLGTTVHKGDVLARLDNRTLRADLAAAQASVHQVEAQRNIAASTLERQKALLAKGHISAQRLEEIDANLLAAEAATRVAYAQVQTLKARLALLQIVAPYDGIIAERYIDEGAIAAPGAPVFSLVEDAVLEARIGLPVSRLADMSLGALYNFNTSSASFTAKLRGLSGQIDPATQTLSAVFDINSNTGILIPGQTARLQLNVPLEQSGFWVPLSALREDRRGLWSLYALDKDTAYADRFILSPRLVEVLYAGAEKIYVRGPIQDGTLILVGGNQSVSAGMAVIPAQNSNVAQP